MPLLPKVSGDSRLTRNRSVFTISILSRVSLLPDLHFKENPIHKTAEQTRAPHFKLKNFTFVSPSLRELDILRVRRKDADPPPTGPLHRRGFVGSLGQTRDLGVRSGGAAAAHRHGFYTCKDLRVGLHPFARLLNNARSKKIKDALCA